LIVQQYVNLSKSITRAIVVVNNLFRSTYFHMGRKRCKHICR